MSAPNSQSADQSLFYEDECDLSDDWPYCECQNDVDEEEDAFNVCKSCGKPLT